MFIFGHYDLQLNLHLRIQQCCHLQDTVIQNQEFHLSISWFFWLQSNVSVDEKRATFPTAYAISGLVFVDRWSRLPTADWYNSWSTNLSPSFALTIFVFPQVFLLVLNYRFRVSLKIFNICWLSYPDISIVQVVNLNTNKILKLTHVSNVKRLSYCIDELLDVFRCFSIQDDVVVINSNDKDLSSWVQYIYRCKDRSWIVWSLFSSGVCLKLHSSILITASNHKCFLQLTNQMFFPFDSNCSGCFMYISSFSSPFKNEIATSSWLSWSLCLAANATKVRTDSNLTTGQNVSS